MDLLVADLSAVNTAPPFFDVKNVVLSDDGAELVVTFKLAPPLNEVRVRMSDAYRSRYPHGPLSAMVAGRFHAISPGTGGTPIAALVRHLYDLCLMSAGDMGAPHGTMSEPTESGMTGGGTGGATSESWCMEPTLEYGADGKEFLGLSDALKADVEAVKAHTKCTATVQDMPAVGRAVVCIAGDELTEQLRRTDFGAYDLQPGVPVQIRVTVDRAQYRAAPMSVQVGQESHFRANQFPPVTVQIASILTNMCAAHCSKENADAVPPLDALTGLGYGHDAAARALALVGNDVDAACVVLADMTPEELVDASSTAKSGTAAYKAPNQSATRNSAASVKRVPNHPNVLVALVWYLKQRMTTLTQFCVICDRPHVFAGSNMALPSVCSREICVFRFTKLGVARDRATHVAVQTGVVDLLINIARAAAASKRANLIFNPFPHVVDEKTGKTVLDPAVPNYEEANRIIQAMPVTRHVAGSDSIADLRTRMDQAHPHAFAAFQWIVSSNRAYIVKLDESKNIPWMGTKYQYHFITANPEREADFNRLKAKHGSKWAYHGSQAENWHSILRNGLKNASGTKLQVNGTAYGHGIYLSPNASTSFGYSSINNDASQPKKQAHMSSDFIDLQTMRCIAICEVVNFELRESGAVWVQPHESCVVTRFLFVYSHGFSEGYNVNLNEEKYTADLRRVASESA